MWCAVGMARPLRVNIADGWYHVMHRGIERRDIFVDARDRRHFLSLLEEVCVRYRFRVHAYCLLNNHYHGIIQTPDANLSQGMQWFGLSYSSWFNARHRRVGTLFQGRFRSVPVEDGAWVYELSQYVHLNPVRLAGFGLDRAGRRVESEGLKPTPTPGEAAERLKRLRDHRWSSYRAYAGYETGPAWLTTTVILKRASRRREERRRRYRAEVQRLLRRGAKEGRLDRFRDVVAIGSAAFVDRVRKLAGEGERETERRGRLREKVLFDDILAALEKVRGEDRGDWLHKHGDCGKWLVLYVARRYCGLTLRQLGEQLGGMDYAAVCMGTGRFEKRMRRDRALRKLHAEVVKVLHV